MLGMIKIYILFSLQYMLIKCLMPGIPAELSVRKFDRKLIERKRQDTVDMCRIFTEETEKLDRWNEFNRSNEILDVHRRGKREIGLQAVNPALNQEDAIRIEGIVDKMYEDLNEQGENVEYRRGNVSAFVGSNNDSEIKSGRRFNFAPAFLGLRSTSQRPFTPTLPPSNNKARFKHGIVPFFIDSKTYDIHLADTIIKAFDYFEKATCIRLQRLRERPTDRESLQNVEWLYITNPTGIKQCVHSNDRADVKGVQMVVFGYDCMSLGDIAHELMHVLGFPHEHNRPDRDQYVTIMWDNIKPGYRKYFELLKKPYVENMPYDYASVLHYPPRAFSRNGQVTIMTQPGVKIGQREGLSELDVEKIGLVYSHECVKRNKEYLLKTCPTVVKADTRGANTTKREIQEYYNGRLWPFGIVNYKLKDKNEFSHEEIENIKAVILHIEKETCIEFRDLTAPQSEEEDSEYDGKDDKTKDEKDDNTENKLSGDDDNNAKDDDKPKGIQTVSLVHDELSSETDSEKIKGNIIKLSMSDSDRFPEEPGVSFKSAKRFLRRKKSLHLKDFADNPKKKHMLRKKQVRKSNKTENQRSPSRRHASSILTFTRSPNPGCACPKNPGRPNATQTVEINADCFNSVNDLLHLFVHILGLDHQHNSHDRDSYLHIVWDQLTDKVRQDMEKKLPPAASVGFPYDYQSVMHYPWLQIKNGRTNIMYPIWNDGWAMGHWQGLSSIDIQKLNLLYYKACMLRKNQAEGKEAEKVTPASNQ